MKYQKELVMTITCEKNLGVTEGKMKGLIKPAYRTDWGVMYQGDCEEILKRYPLTRQIGKVQLVLTSPPFPLNRKKKYGNLTGEEYLNWLKNLAPLFRNYLSPYGSIVLELGNAWEAGNPVMSTLPLKALMAFLEAKCSIRPFNWALHDHPAGQMV